MSYLVTSPLVLVRVPDQVGDGYRLDYHYQGSVILWLSEEQADHFLAEKLVVKVGAPAPADEADGADEAGVERPAKTATKPVLIAWLVENAVDVEGNDYDADELDQQYDKAGLWGLIDSVE